MTGARIRNAYPAASRPRPATATPGARRRGRIPIRLPLAILASICVTGCGAEDAPGPIEPSVPVATAVSVSPDSVRLVALGDTTRLGVLVSDQNGAAMDQPVTWRSTVPAVVSVSASGLVMAQTPGLAEVVASIGVDSDTTYVRVEQIADTVHAEPAVLELAEPGDTVTVTATALDALRSEIPSAALIWATSDGAVATVSAVGVVTAVAPGLATISVTADGATTVVPVEVLGPTLPRYGFRPTLAIGGEHACQIGSSFRACWGKNSYGQIGDGTTSVLEAYPSDPGWELDFTLLTAGIRFTCGLSAEGEAYCWGQNLNGALGVGAAANAVVMEPTRVPSVERWTYLEGIGVTVCGVTATGKGFCWGKNVDGELGDSTTMDRNEPAPVAGGHTWYMISPGVRHTCGVDTDRSLWCWGANYSGQLGLGTSGADVLAPTLVDETREWESVSAGQSKTCAITLDGDAYCWGDTGLGDGSNGSSTSPVKVSGGHRWASLRSVIGTCGITTAGEAYCWGPASRGQIGSGAVYAADIEEPVPQPVAGGHTWKSLSTGRIYGYCGESSTGDVLCWGDNGHPRLCSSPAWAPEPFIASEAEEACVSGS